MLPFKYYVMDLITLVIFGTLTRFAWPTKFRFINLNHKRKIYKNFYTRRKKKDRRNKYERRKRRAAVIFNLDRRLICSCDSMLYDM